MKIRTLPAQGSALAVSVVLLSCCCCLVWNGRAHGAPLPLGARLLSTDPVYPGDLVGIEAELPLETACKDAALQVGQFVVPMLSCSGRRALTVAPLMPRGRYGARLVIGQAFLSGEMELDVRAVPDGVHELPRLDAFRSWLDAMRWELEDVSATLAEARRLGIVQEVPHEFLLQLVGEAHSRLTDLKPLLDGMNWQTAWFVNRVLGNLGFDRPEGPTIPGLMSHTNALKLYDPKYVVFYALIRLDNLSMVLTNVNSVLDPLSTVLTIIPGTNAIGVVLSVISTCLGLVDAYVDSCLPTDLQALRLVTEGKNCATQEVPFEVRGDFGAQGGDIVEEMLKAFILEVLLKGGDSEAAKKLIENLKDALIELFEKVLVEMGYKTSGALVLDLSDCAGLVPKLDDVAVDVDYYTGNLDTVLLVAQNLLTVPPFPIIIEALLFVFDLVGIDIEVFGLEPVQVTSGNAYVNLSKMTLVPFSPQAVKGVLDGWRMGAFSLFDICVVEGFGVCLLNFSFDYEWVEGVESKFTIAVDDCTPPPCLDEDGDGFGYGAGCTGWDCDDWNPAVHVPDCEGKKCGLDGCGGQCGVCSGYQECVNGQCVCFENCVGKACGPDGCGSQCGLCPPGKSCIGGQCECVGTCFGVDCGGDGCGGDCGTCITGQKCQNGLCVQVGGMDCDPCQADSDCEGQFSCISVAPSLKVCSAKCVTDTQCGLGFECKGGFCVPVLQTSCAGNAVVTKNFCGHQVSSKTCPVGKKCKNGQCVCSAQCLGIQCGDDGCGGTCGFCPNNQLCQNGTCVPQPCTATCAGKVCGYSACGDPCGICPSGQECIAGKCKCVPSCVGAICGPDGCGGLCGDCASGTCYQGTCVCTPTCAAKECGLDGCGGSCGYCPPGSACTGGKCVCQFPANVCEIKECGLWPDACQEVVDCGDCGSGFYCNTAGKCVCQPTCQGKKCGPDGCPGQGTCGNCPPGFACTADGQCMPSCPGGFACGKSCCAASQKCVAGSCCTPTCNGKECGYDGCGGVCGTCDVGEICNMTGPEWKCKLIPCIPNCKGKVCGSDGCFATCLPGCAPNEKCVEGMCLCNAKTCADLGKECGQWADSCGGTVDCGPAEPICLTLFKAQSCLQGKLKVLDCSLSNQVCKDGECVDPKGMPCDVLGGQESLCIGDILFECLNGVVMLTDCSKMGFVCAFDAQEGAHACVPVCIPTCKDKDCGNDGCGGSCGECPEGELCFEDHRCCECKPGAVGKCGVGGVRSCDTDCHWSDCNEPPDSSSEMVESPGDIRTQEEVVVVENDDAVSAAENPLGEVRQEEVAPPQHEGATAGGTVASPSCGCIVGGKRDLGSGVWLVLF
ncbi:MAG: hypothetical protein FJ109_09855, partial [Deltaproteobacteria bacterium]|nr:hypothetical protein [Deltaproteobacteria bacterium]